MCSHMFIESSRTRPHMTARDCMQPCVIVCNRVHQVDEKTKKERLRRINALAGEHALERRQRYLGRLEEVLVELRNPKHPAQVKGRNRQGCPVFFDGDIDELKGQLVPVRITEAGTYFLVGEREEDKFAGGRYVADEGDVEGIESAVGEETGRGEGGGAEDGSRADGWADPSTWASEMQ